MHDCCFICGAEIIHLGEPHEWLGWFRSVYVEGHNWFQAHISDKSTESTWQRRLRLTNNGAQQHGLPRLPTDIQEAQPSFTHTSQDEQRWGHKLHEDCWTLLTAACYPLEPDIGKLHQFLLSFPYNFRTTNWGHTYGDAIIADPPKKNRVPGGEIYLKAELDWTLPNGHQRPIYENPMDTSGFDGLLGRCIKARRDEEPASDQPTPNVQVSSKQPKSLLEDLPFELHEQILFILKTPDVQSLCRAAPIFSIASSTQSFYESRFFPDQEFGHIFEAIQRPIPNGTYCDWIQLYDDMHEIAAYSGSLENRRRIWECLLPLAKGLETYSGLTCSGEPRSTYWEPDFDHLPSTREEIKSPIQHPQRAHFNGSRVFFSREVLVDFAIDTIHVSYLNWFEDRWVTGVRFVGSGQTESLGYILPGKEEEIAVVSSSVGDTQGPHFGFQIAKSSRGFHALCVSQGTNLSHPSKDFNCKALTFEGVSFKGRQSVQAQFDGLKMVSFSVS